MTVAALVPALIGSRAYDADGARIGHVADVLLDVRTGVPAWILLELPRITQRFVLVPADGLYREDDGVHLACRRADVHAARATAAPTDGLTPSQALASAAHFGVACGAGPWHGVVEPALVGAGGRMRIAS